MAIVKLSAHNIFDLLAANHTPAHDFNVIVEDSLASTNDYLMQLLAESTEPLPKTAVLAEEQTGGKGRNGKNWVSIRGNIHLSVYWPFQCTLDKLYGLSLVVGVAIARVLKANGLIEVQLKWPNDIYWHARKLGGILIETKPKGRAAIDTIIGIGLNIIAMEEYAAQINQKFVSLEDALQCKIYRDKLVAQLLLELNTVLNQFAQEGLGAFLEEWKTLDSKIMSNSVDTDIYAKIINAEKTQLDLGDKFLH